MDTKDPFDPGWKIVGGKKVSTRLAFIKSILQISPGTSKEYLDTKTNAELRNIYHKKADQAFKLLKMRQR